MLAIESTQGTTQPVESMVPIPETRFEASPTDLPFTPPPYSSLIDDALIDNFVHKYNNAIRQNALHPIFLHAGQSAPPNGGIGRFAAPQLPEILGGAIVGINI